MQQPSKMNAAISKEEVVKRRGVHVTQSGLTGVPGLTDGRPPGSSVRGILQARVLEWVAISFSRGSSQPRD